MSTHAIEGRYQVGDLEFIIVFMNERGNYRRYYAVTGDSDIEVFLNNGAVDWERYVDYLEVPAFGITVMDKREILQAALNRELGLSNYVRKEEYRPLVDTD